MRKPQEREGSAAFAACASVLFGEAMPIGDTLERSIRRRNLIYSIDNHLDARGMILDPLTRALLAASREAMALDNRDKNLPETPQALSNSRSDITARNCGGALSPRLLTATPAAEAGDVAINHTKLFGLNREESPTVRWRGGRKRATGTRGAHGGAAATEPSAGRTTSWPKCWRTGAASGPLRRSTTSPASPWH